jgi:phosphoglucomutase
MVRRWPARRLPRFRWRGKCRRLLPAPRRHDLDDRQGRHGRGPAGGGNHRPQRPRSGQRYREIAGELGDPLADRLEAPADAEQKARLAKLSPAELAGGELAGEKITNVLDRAPGNQAPIGGIKVSAASGWFAARPSGTEAIYKIYAESFKGRAHLQAILQQAQAMVDRALKAR